MKFKKTLLIAAGLAMAMGSQAVSVQEIYSFPSMPLPNSVLVQDAAGAFYGTTSGGGDFGAGTIYRATTNGTIQTLVSFDNTNGASPNGGLVLGGDGALYGTTYQGGSANFGTVFRITTNGDLTTLVAFNVVTNGAYPQSGLIRGAGDIFYGTTTWGGPDFTGDGTIGTIFRVTTNGILTTLASFVYYDGTNQYPNGMSPTVLVMGKNGVLYGATQTGGSNDSGTIFQVTTNGSLSTLASFTDTNGFKDYVNLVTGSNGVFYGTTYGSQTERSTIFQLNTNGELTTLATFTNGFRFNTGLARASDGSYFATADPGVFETNYYGSRIFRLDIGKGAATLTQLEELDGYFTEVGLVFGQDGALYGAANAGGDNNYGAVFKVATNGDLTALASFENSYGAEPNGGLVQGNDGMFYGTSQGGAKNYGTVFRITADGALTTLLTFDGENGGYPQGGLAADNDEALYGTTSGGGMNFRGTVFRVTTNGILTTLASFDGTNGDYPSAALTLGTDGLFYGTTAFGGSNDVGTVFRIGTNGNLKVLSSFSQTNGANPYSALLQGSDGAFYGTTATGGAYDVGTVFRVTTDGDLTTLVSFDNTNGANSQTSLTLGEDGAFYGTTSQGGSNNWGTVFRITTNGSLTTLVSFSPNTQLVLPNTDLISDNRGAFYGGAGELFRVTTNGTLTALAPNFYASEFGNLIHASNNWYYGTTSSFWSGSKGGGSIFRMNPSVQMLPLTHNTAAWTVNFNGIPGDSYQVLRATNLPGPWDVLTNATADLNGNGLYRDLHPPSGSAFYWIGLP